MNGPGKDSFWQQFSEEFKDLFYTKEELEYRNKVFRKSVEEMDLTVIERVAKKIAEYEGRHQPNSIFLGSQVLFQLRISLLNNGKPINHESISDIKIAQVYGLNVIEVHSKPHLISVAYIKDI